MTTSKSTQGLRFAPIVRVSGEAQERKGESLRTQRGQILRWVEHLGGTIPEACWAYCGQEHASVGEERRRLNALLVDAGSGLFDAVIVCDPSRWARDNKKSKEGLEVLKRHGIRFFVGSSEKNLFSPTDAFFLGMSTEVNEFVAMEQARKSLENRIERARRGIPVTSLPYGRTFDRKTQTWGVIEEEAERMRWAVNVYLKDGKRVEKVAQMLGVEPSTLFLRFRHGLGEEWKVSFNSERLNIHEQVTIRVPPLVDEETIKAVHDRMAANRTYAHKKLKVHEYLLSRVVFCANCGSAFSGSKPKNVRRYRHLPGERLRGRRAECLLGNRSVRADDLERAVVAHLFSLFGDPTVVEEAVKRATPDVSRRDELLGHLARLDRDVQDVKNARDRLRQAIMAGTIAPDDLDAKRDNAKLTERGHALTQEREGLARQIANLPDGKEIRRRAHLPLKFWKRYARDYHTFAQMDFERQRRLVVTAFAGLDAEGRRLGVYVKEEGGRWVFEVRGVLPEVRAGVLPVSEDAVDHLLGVSDAEADRRAEAESQWEAQARSGKGEGKEGKDETDATTFSGSGCATASPGMSRGKWRSG